MRQYLSPIADGGRWEGFAHRPGDVVISTPSKCGTTWTQMLVALLVFGGPDLPRKLSELSPWLDADLTPLEDVTAELAAQQHRRFIKTHVPLDGLPLDEEVCYVVVGRDPRDVLLSYGQHNDNIDGEHLRPALQRAIGEDELQRRIDAAPHYEGFVDAIDLPAGACHACGHPAQVLHHLWDAWQRRNDANVHLMHYADMSADLGAELRGLATALGFTHGDAELSSLAAHAGLDAMRARADHLVPQSDTVRWRSPADFFRSGRMGAWADAFAEEDLRRYQERMTELFPDEEFLAWAHVGGGAADWRV